MNVHGVKLVQLINLCAQYCGSSLAVLNRLTLLYIMLPCMVAVVCPALRGICLCCVHCTVCLQLK